MSEKRTNFVDGFNKPAKLISEHDDGTVIYEETTRTITPETKSRLYREGNYSCRLNTPVNHTMWDDTSWINWADNSGRWWLDGCYWEKIKGTLDQYRSCRSSGFIERWNKAKDDHVTKGEEASREETPFLENLPTVEQLKQILK